MIFITFSEIPMREWKIMRMRQNATKKAIDIKPDNSAYYRDYAIAMAYTGNMEEAEKKRWRRT